MKYHPSSQCSADGPPWALVSSASTKLTAGLIIRGPMALNAVHMTEGVLRERAEVLMANMKRCDTLATIGYAGDLRDSMVAMDIML